MEVEGEGGIVKRGQAEKLSAPPGFVSLTAFTLKRSEDNGAEHPVDSRSAFESEILQPTLSSALDDSEMVKMIVLGKKRPWIVYSQCNYDADEFVPKKPDTVGASKACLPKGVIRGCRECSKCQKVIARWDPGKSCRVSLKEAPSFHPGEEEFRDALKYIESISKQVEPYGLCRIVPPSSWKLPSLLNGRHMWQSSTFIPHVQRIHELQRYYTERKFSASKIAKRRKREKSFKADLDNEICDVDSARNDGVNGLECNSCPQFTLQSFEEYADYFKKNYFTKLSFEGNDISSSSIPQGQRELSEEDIEGEYWRIVENPTEEIEVLCGSSLDSRTFGSGFPVSSKTEASVAVEYLQSSWNLNNTSRLPLSFLAFESSDASSIVWPQLHIGMCFSSVPWKVEDYHLYALCYLHMGEPRIWYGVPGSYSQKFEEVVKKYFPYLSGQNSVMPHKLDMQLSPTTLISEGVPVHRCIQYPGDFVLFLPGAYYSGFDSGFNCSESANFAPLDWLPHGQNVLELYHEQRRKTSLSYHKLLLRAANEAVETQWEILLKGKKTFKDLRWKDACGKDGILAKALRLCIKSEARLREYLSISSQWRKMDKYFDAAGKKECITCYCDLYLSAASCACNPDRYSCLLHARNLCHCGWSVKIFLIRYEISELDVLVEAVEGKYSAIHRWVKENHGLALDLNLPHNSPSNAARDSAFLDGSSGIDNHEANSMSTFSDDGAVNAFEKLLLDAKKHILEDTSFWDEASRVDMLMPGGNEKVDAIEKLISVAEKRILGEVPLDDANGRGVSLEGVFSSRDSSEYATSSASSMNSDGEGSVLGTPPRKSEYAPSEKERDVDASERVSSGHRYENGVVECIEVDSGASSLIKSVPEKPLQVKSLSGETQGTICLSDEEDGP